MSTTEILKMIETVDPSDRSALDDIDLAVGEYLGKFPKPVSKYTRSRDALKAIRQDGWFLKIQGAMSAFTRRQAGEFLGGWLCDMADNTDGSGESMHWVHSYKCGLPTEELAELHAIIQSIEYERTNS